jgi:signal transduction histidine kinase
MIRGSALTVPPGTVLVVEDDADIRDSLAAVLEDEGLAVSTAQHGAEALRMLRSGPLPSVVLLDLMMPVMNGWELVQRMRDDPRLAAIPVVVTSAAADRPPPEVDCVLPKPIDLARLLEAVRGYCGQAARGEMNPAVRELARRNIELAELRRFRDEMAAMVVHDLKGPLGAVLAEIQLLRRGPVSEDDKQIILGEVEYSARRALRIAENLLQLARLETGAFILRRSTMRVSSLLDPLVEQRRRLASESGITIATEPGDDPAVELDDDLISRALENLVDNGLRHTPARGRMRVAAARQSGRLRFEVGNSGPPVPPASRQRIFEKFGQDDPGAGRTNAGLGLYFCRLVAEAHGGKVWVEERAEYPATFVVEVPS